MITVIISDEDMLEIKTLYTPGFNNKNFCLKFSKGSDNENDIGTTFRLSSRILPTKEFFAS